MDSQFEGRRLSLVRLSDGARFGGWSVKFADDKWVLQLNGDVPDPEDIVRVIFYDEGQNGVTQGKVCLIQGQSVVIERLGPYNTVATNQEARFRIVGIEANWNSPEGPVEIEMVDFSRSGFGFEAFEELPTVKNQTFSIKIEGEFQPYYGDIVHIRKTETGRFRGGVRLKFETRLHRAYWVKSLKKVA